MLPNVIVSFVLLATLFQGADYKVVGRYQIGGVGGFDYVMLDGPSRVCLSRMQLKLRCSTQTAAN
jgi:hypothetical protein